MRTRLPAISRPSVLFTALAALLLLPLPALPASAQLQGCPYQFPSCTSACNCLVSCFTPCCNGREAKICNEVLCEGYPQCYSFSSAVEGPAMSLLDGEGGSCAAPLTTSEPSLENLLALPVSLAAEAETEAS